MNGDHTVLGVTYQLSEVIGGTVLPVVALGLGSFVSFIQAFVFTLLTVVYIALSVHDDHDEHH
jgi:F-type H+-transporting ATPase subunit a